MVTWARTGNPNVDMRRVVQDRLARARSVEGNVVSVGAPSAIDFVRAKVRGTMAAGLRIFGGR